jgi:hypothetical protein
MNARFGIIAGLSMVLAGCNDGRTDDLFVEGTAALDCNGGGCTFAGATKPGDAPKTPDDNGYGHGGYGHGGHDSDDGHDSDGDDDHGGHGNADAGAPCAYDDDCAIGERCERRHGVSYCAPHDDDDDYDRSGSNSGPH